MQATRHIIIDARGKALAKGGRYKVAKHVRFLRGTGAGNGAARHYIMSAKLAYAADAGPFDAWTAGQQKNNRMIEVQA